ncbi:MAG: adenylate/guanylate cyclase domain-containing protein [Desulfobacteraceae bacterium]|nr:adenylate/guanylate cyclase domain-containing protein [Desulfobacteraceae bacterium]
MTRQSARLTLTPFKAGVVMIFLACLLFYSFGGAKPDFLLAMDNRLLDTMIQWRGARPTTGSVIIVDIDEKSLQTIGQWPWPRNILATLTDNIHKAGPRALGFDMVFPEADRSSPSRFLKEIEKALPRALPPLLHDLKDLDHDRIFGNALSRGNTVLGYVFQTRDDGLKAPGDQPFPSARIVVSPLDAGFMDLTLIPAYRAILNIPSIAMARTEGFFNVFADIEGTLHRVPLIMAMDGMPYPSMSLETFRLGMEISTITLHAATRIKDGGTPILGISLDQRFIPTDENGQIAVNFRGPPNSFPYVPAVEIIQGKHLHRLKNKFVLIGTTAAGLFDFRATPFSPTCPGVEVNATIIDNLMAQDPLVYDLHTEIGLTYTLVIAGGLLLTLLLVHAPPLTGAIGGLVIMAGILVGNHTILFLNNRQAGTTFPLISLLAIYIIVTTQNFFREGRDRRYIQRAFGHYVSPRMVDRLMADPTSLSLTGEQRELTIMFSDIRDFTTISESMDSRDLGAFMNEYLTIMSDIVMKHNGTVDKFIGDAIMAFWGAPAHDPRHAINAVKTALAMLHKLREMQGKWIHRNLPFIDMGVGINTGLVSVGNFGSRSRFDYTVMGDAVNLASRLEGANKNYGSNIIVSEFTRESVGKKFFCRYVDRVRVKGKEKAVEIYEPLVTGTPPKTMAVEVRAFEDAVGAYRQQRFREALAAMDKLNRTSPQPLYEAYIQRIHAYMKHPPPPEWDGVERRVDLRLPQAPPTSKAKP